MSRGRAASLPQGRPATARGLIELEDGSKAVRFFSQGGHGHRDYDVSCLQLQEPVRTALIEAFVQRLAPGSKVTSESSAGKAHAALVGFDRFLAQLRWPPQAVSHLTAEHFDGYFELRKAVVKTAPAELRDLRLLLLKVTGISEALMVRLAGQLPARKVAEPKTGYSRMEFGRIAEAARADLRIAARRIRDNRAVLQRFRDGELIVEPKDVHLRRRLQLLDSVDRFADVPRRHQPGSYSTEERPAPEPWVQLRGAVKDIVSWLHLSASELGAAAVLLGVMTGENPEPIFKVPAAHHRADGHGLGPGTAIVDLTKLRRGRRAHMTLPLTEVPDWISIPADPESISSRDELHTAFGLYVLLHELTAGSRALAPHRGELLIGYSSSSPAYGRGLRPINGSEIVTRWGAARAIAADKADAEGNPVPLGLRLDLIRLTFIELNQRPVAQTVKTAATTYLARNRASVGDYRKVVAVTLTKEVEKARTRTLVRMMTDEDLARAKQDPEQVAAEQGLDVETLVRMIDGRLDTVMTACTDHEGGRHNPGPCRASFMLCLECECARALPRHLPVQIAVHDRLLEQRGRVGALAWAERFAGAHARLADLLSQHDDTTVADTRAALGAEEFAVADRFLKRELDLR